MTTIRATATPDATTTSRSRGWRRPAAALFGAAAAIAATTVAVAATGGSPGDYQSVSLARPAPAAVVDYFPVAYETDTTLTSAEIDADAGTVTLPLQQGRMSDGKTVWYVLTDTSDLATARRLGLNWSPKLANAPQDAMRTATMDDDGNLEFDQGTVDFSPDRVVVPGEGPDFFPPAQAQPGSVGDDAYSPLVSVTNAAGTVLNASVVAFDVDADEIEFPDGDVDHDKVVDRAVAISPEAGTVTFSTSVGTATGRPVLFISLDSNDNTVSALEGTTYAPALSNLEVGRNDAPDSAVAANYIIANGPTGADNPQRQGLNSALSDPGAQVLDIFDGSPGLINGEAYSPMWDLYVTEWTAEAIDKGYRAAIHSELEIVGLAQRGWLTGPGGADFGPSGLISNSALLGHL